MKRKIVYSLLAAVIAVTVISYKAEGWIESWEAEVAFAITEEEYLDTIEFYQGRIIELTQADLTR